MGSIAPHLAHLPGGVSWLPVYLKGCFTFSVCVLVEIERPSDERVAVIPGAASPIYN